MTVTAGDIICPTGVEVLNKDLEIAHLEEGATLEMELKARNGRGYISADGNKALYQGSSQGLETVYTDSIYTRSTVFRTMWNRLVSARTRNTTA